MIEHNTSRLAIEAGEQMNKAGLMISPIPGTALATLVRMSTVAPVTAEEFDAKAMTDASDNEMHEAAMGEAVDLLVESTRNHMDFARNTASPAITEYIAKLQDLVGDLSIQPYFDFKIAESGVPEFLEGSDMMEVIERYNTGSSIVPGASMRYPNYPNAKLIAETIKTGSGAIDRMIDKWLAALPEEYVQTVWQSVFQDKEMYPATAPIVAIDSLLKDSTHGIDASLIVFLLAQRLTDEITSDAGMSLSELRSRLNDLRVAAACSIVRHKNFIETYKATGTVVRGWTGMVATVDKAAYEDYLAAGGRVEVILGAMVGGKSWYTNADLTNNAEEAMAIWGAYQNANQSRTDNEMVAKVKTVAIQLFKESLDNELPGEKEIMQSPGAKQGMINEFIEKVSELAVGEIMSDVSDVMWRLVCKTRFGYTGAYSILSNIDYYVKKHGMTHEEAASQSMYLYLQKYVNGMFEVKSAQVAR